MNITDPISDLLTRLRNALRSGHEKTELPHSRLRVAILKVLAAEGFVAGVRDSAEAGPKRLQVRLKYDSEGLPIVTGLQRISRPGRRVYRRAEDLTPVLGGMGVAVVSTSRGLMTDREAREKKLGGEVLFNVW